MVKKALSAIMDQIDGIMHSRDVNQNPWYSRVLSESGLHLGKLFLYILDRVVNHQEQSIEDPDAAGTPSAEQHIDDDGDGINHPDDYGEEDEDEDATLEQEDRMPDTAIIDLDRQAQELSTRQE